MKDIKIDNTMKTIADGLERVNTTIEDGLKKVEASKKQKLSWRERTWWKIAKAAVKGILLAPLVWISFVLGSILIYGLAYSIALGMGVCFKFLGL